MSKHAESRCHKEAVDRLLSIPRDVGDVSERLDSQLTVQRQENRECLIQILRAVRFLARQGLAFRGSSKSGSGEVDGIFFAYSVATLQQSRESATLDVPSNRQVHQCGHPE